MNTQYFAGSRHRTLCAVAVSLLSFTAVADDAADDPHHDIDEIVVEATALPRTVEQLAQPTSVLSGDELARSTAASIGETLSSELGLSSTYFGPVASRPVIRGQFGERVRVLSNGLDALDASALSEDHQVSVDGILADRVEIVRGPATLLYGSGAAGGLVNVIDNRISGQPLESSVQGKLAFGMDSAVGETSGAGWVKFGTDAFAVHLDYFRRDTDDIDIPGFTESALLRELEEAEEHEEEGHEEEEARGSIENSDSSSDGGALALTWTGDNGFVGVSLSTFDSEYGVPGGHGHEHEEEEMPGEEEEEEEEIVRIDLEQTRVDLRGEYRFSGPFERVLFRLADNDYEHVELEGDEVGTLYETDGFDSRLELQHRPLGELEGAIGLQYERIDFNAVGDEAFVPASETTRTSLFTFHELPASDALVFQGSLRYENQTIDGSDVTLIDDSTMAIDYDESAFGAAIGAVWTANDMLTLSAHYSVTERHPNATELYAQGAHVAVQRFELGSVILGNGILDKEVSNNFDLTLRGDTERFDWTLTLFNNDVDDYIVLSPTAEIEDDFQVYEYGQVDAELYGFEAEALVELMDNGGNHMHMRLFSDYVHGEEARSGAYLPRLPPLRYGVSVHYIREALEFSVSATGHDEQNKTAANELPTDSYTLLDAGVSYHLHDRGLFLFLKGTNLGDEDARQHSSPLKDTVPLPGRSLHAGVRFEF